MMPFIVTIAGRVYIVKVIVQGFNDMSYSDCNMPIINELHSY